MTDEKRYVEVDGKKYEFENPHQCVFYSTDGEFDCNYDGWCAHPGITESFCKWKDGKCPARIVERSGQ